MGENEVAGLPPSGSMASAVTVTDRGVAFDTLSRLPLCHRAVVSRVSGLSRYVVETVQVSVTFVHGIFREWCVLGLMSYGVRCHRENVSRQNRTRSGLHRT